MIDVKEAVELAKQYCSKIFEQPGKVEEVDRDDNYWLITLSIEEAVKSSEIQKALIGWGVENNKKAYKLFKVDGENGHVVSAKIRQLS